MLKDVPIIVREPGGQLYKVGNADATKGGTDVVLYFDGTKVSRHGDGNFWSGPVGAGTTGRSYELRVPSTSVVAEPLCSITVSSDVTLRGRLYTGPKVDDSSAFVFPSTALASPNVAFGAAFVDLSRAEDTIAALNTSGTVVSAATYRDTGIGKAVVLWVTHSRST